MTHRQLRMILNESLINPKKPGPMRVITDADNPEYWCQRAVEFIQEGNQAIGGLLANEGIMTVDERLRKYQHNLKKAITLLSLARGYSYDPTKAGKEDTKSDKGFSKDT